MKHSWLTKIIVFILFAFIVIILAAGITKADSASIANLFGNEEFISAVFFSLKTSAIATLFSFVIGVPAGFFLSRNRGFFCGLLDAVFDIPVVVPPLVVGVFILVFFNFPVVKQFYPLIFTMPGAVVAQFFVAAPLTIKASKNAFDLVPSIYEKVAMTLGSRPFRAFFDTTFKIAFPGILSGLILTWLRCMGEFGATLMVGGGIPFKTENIPINIYLNMTGGNYKNAVAASVVSIAIAFICIIVVRSIYYGLRLRK